MFTMWQRGTLLVLVASVSFGYCQKNWGPYEEMGHGDSGPHRPGPRRPDPPRPNPPPARDGGWGSWSEWTECTKPCGGGSQTRHRLCDDPAPRNGGKDCSGLANKGDQLRLCNTESCEEIVDGGWDDWTEWTPCSVSCGDGRQTRTRDCARPLPSGGGKDCSGGSAQRKKCTLPCPVNGGWSDWESWGSCSVTCGTGSHSRSRPCTSPAPSHGGFGCIGESEQTEMCTIDATCPVNGGWSDWESWGSCSVSCGTGSISRSRSCTSPAPSDGGDECIGDATETETCKADTSCPVNGAWGEWSNWSRCSAECGRGLRFKQRLCDNPSPSNGGANCRGRRTMKNRCSADIPCAVDGGWTDWKEWSECSVPCGGGTRDRSRSCTNPSPQFGGRGCPGAADEVLDCNMNRCIVHGGWAVWSEWTRCSVDCGGGSQTRRRTCTNPVPSFDGNNCEGPVSERKNCNYDIKCTVDGNWSDWQEWTGCSVSCGGGMRSRQRACSNPPPVNGGSNCRGRAIDEEPCNQHSCQVNGGWTDWTDWSPCSTTCGAGTETKTRSCSDPRPVNGGQDCTGPATRLRRCNMDVACPVHGGWSEWSAFSLCSTSCGRGEQMRSRVCNSPTPSVGGDFCNGPQDDVRICNENFGCVVDGRWGEWSFWSQCSVSCGSGIQGRSRLCDSPTPSNGGKFCAGGSARSGQGRNCNAGECLVAEAAVWNAWGSWSDCSVTCGEGTQTRSRTCSAASPSHCSGHHTDSTRCRALVRCVNDAGGESGPYGGAGESGPQDLIYSNTWEAEAEKYGYNG